MIKKLTLFILLLLLAACVYDAYQAIAPTQYENHITLTSAQHDKWHYDLVASGFVGFELWVYVYEQNSKEEAIPILQLMSWLDFGWSGLEMMLNWDGEIIITRTYTLDTVVWYFEFDGSHAQISFPLHTSPLNPDVSSEYSFTYATTPVYEDVSITLLTRTTGEFTYMFKLIMTN